MDSDTSDDIVPGTPPVAGSSGLGRSMFVIKGLEQRFPGQIKIKKSTARQPNHQRCTKKRSCIHDDESDNRSSSSRPKRKSTKQIYFDDSDSDEPKLKSPARKLHKWVRDNKLSSKTDNSQSGETSSKQVAGHAGMSMVTSDDSDTSCSESLVQLSLSAREMGIDSSPSSTASSVKLSSQPSSSPLETVHGLDMSDEEDSVVIIDDSPTPGSGGADDSMVRRINQMEDDEAMARRLQEEMDAEFALSVANTSSPLRGLGVPSRQRLQPRNRSPVSVALSRSPRARRSGTRQSASNWGRSAERSSTMLTRIGELSEYNWQVYEATLAGRPIPRPTPGQPEAVIDQDILQFLRNRRESSSSSTDDVDSPITFSVPQPRPRTRPQTRRQTHQRLYLQHGSHSGDADLIVFEQIYNRAHSITGRNNALFMSFPGSTDNGSDYENLLALAEQLGDAVNKGLAPHQINMLPTVPYKTDSTTADKVCNICMTDYEDGDNLRMLPCFHRFHTDCIDPWIKEKPTCPVCRVEVKLDQRFEG